MGTYIIMCASIAGKRNSWSRNCRHLLQFSVVQSCNGFSSSWDKVWCNPKSDSEITTWPWMLRGCTRTKYDAALQQNKSSQESSWLDWEYRQYSWASQQDKRILQDSRQWHWVFRLQSRVLQPLLIFLWKNVQKIDLNQDLISQGIQALMK